MYLVLTFHNRYSMASHNIPSQESFTVASSMSDKLPKKWIWGALGVVSALALGVAVSRRGLSFIWRKGSSAAKNKLSNTLTAEWQLIEKIDRVLQQSHIKGIDVYVKNSNVLLVAAPEREQDLLDARDLILAIDGVQSVEISFKAPFASTSNESNAS